MIATIRDEDLISLSEAGRIIGRSDQAMRLYTRANGLPCKKVAGRFVVRRSEFLAWAERPEIRSMLDYGDRLLEWTGRRAMA